MKKNVVLPKANLLRNLMPTNAHVRFNYGNWHVYIVIELNEEFKNQVFCGGRISDGLRD